MRGRALWIAALLASLPAVPAVAQQPVVAATDQQALLTSADKRLAANKRLVYDFWRIVLEAGQLERAGEFLAPDYIQHNPNVPTGRDGFVQFFRQYTRPTAPRTTIRAPLVTILAEGDLVVLAFVAPTGRSDDPKGPYTTTSFDMFCVANGRIVEHWDNQPKD